MTLRTLAASAVVAALCAACANAPGNETKAAHRDPLYRTGSNIPMRDPDAQSRVLSVRPDDVPVRTNMPDQTPGRPPIP
jgi:hypothetical protein